MTLSAVRGFAGSMGSLGSSWSRDGSAAVAGGAAKMDEDDSRPRGTVKIYRDNGKKHEISSLKILTEDIFWAIFVSVWYICTFWKPNLSIALGAYRQIVISISDWSLYSPIMNTKAEHIRTFDSWEITEIPEHVLRRKITQSKPGNI